MYDFAFKLVEDESVPTEFLDYIVESFKQNIKVIDDRPNDIYNYAIAVMNRGVPSIASELLNLVAGRSASGVTRQKIDHHLFVINSLLAKLLQDDELSDSEISELRLLSDQHSEDKYKIGFYILLGEFDSAMEILRNWRSGLSHDLSEVAHRQIASERKH